MVYKIKELLPAISDVPKQDLLRRDRALYAFPSGAHQGDLGSKKPFLLEAIELADLINAELPRRHVFYYGDVGGGWRGVGPAQ